MIDWQVLLVGEEAVSNPKVPISGEAPFKSEGSTSSSEPEVKTKAKKKSAKRKSGDDEFYKTLSLSEVDFDSIPGFMWRGQLERPEVMFVSDSPSFFELKYGFAFCGDAGLELIRAANHAGLDTGDFGDVFSGVQQELRFDRENWSKEYRDAIRENCDKGNVLYWHADFSGKLGQVKKGAKMDKKVAERLLFEASAHLHYHIASTIQPKHIIFLGGPILRAVFDKTNPQAYAGVPFNYTVPAMLDKALKMGNEDEILKELVNTPYKCVSDVDVHPAFAVQREQQNSFRERIRLYIKRRSEGATVEVFEPAYTVFHDYVQAREYLDNLIEEKPQRLCYDTEGLTLTPTAFMHRDGATVSVQFCADGKHGYSVPTFHKDVSWTREQRLEICSRIGQVLMAPREDTIGHNLLYDNLTTRVDPHLGIKSRRLPGRFLDTMITAYVLDETSPKDLKVLCNLYTPFKNYDEELEQWKKANKWENYGDIPWDLLGKYGAYDVIGTWTLLEVLRKKLQESQQGDVYNIAFNLVPIHLKALEDLAVCGQCIDRELVTKVGTDQRTRMEDLTAKISSAPEMVEFIETQRLKAAVDFAQKEVLKPLNTLKKAIEIGTVRESAKKEARKEFTEIRDRIKEGELTVQVDGTITKRNGERDRDVEEKVSPVFERFCAEKYGELENYQPNLNTSGDGEMGEFFFEHLKLPIEYFTEKGAPSLDKEAVPFLAKLHPVAEVFGDYKKVSKEYGMYVKPLLKSFEAFDAGEVYEYPMSIDGFTHFSTFIGTTVTGRSTAEFLQLTPRKGEVKKFFKSRFRFGLIPQADQSQIELRIAAAVSGDEKMVTAYRNGEDLHAKTASLIFGKKFTECQDPVLKKELRSGSKRTNFGVLYGSGAQGLVQTIKQEGVDPLSIGGYDIEAVKAEATFRLERKLRRKPRRYEVEEVLDKIRAEVTGKMLEDFYASYPGLKDWVAQCHEFTKANGFYYNPFGRVRHLPAALNQYDRGSQNEALRQAQNFAIQSAAADVMLTTIAAIEKEIYSRKLRTVPIATVHDSFELDSPLEEAVETIEIVLEYMRDPRKAFKRVGLEDKFDLSWLDKVPIDADAELGPSWGEAYEYKDGSLKLMSEEDGDAEDFWAPVEEFWNVIEDVREIKRLSKLETVS